MIKRSSFLRISVEALALALAALMAFSMALIIERALVRNSAPGEWAASGLALMPAYAAGRLLAKKRTRLKALLHILAVLFSAALRALIFPPQDLAELLPAGAMLIPAAVLCFAGSRAVPAYPPALLASSVALYLLDLVLMELICGGSAVVSICAAANFVLCLLSANLKSVLDGSQSTSGRAPSGMRRKNLLLLAGFTASAFLLASTGVIQKALAFIIVGVWRVLSAVWRFIKGLFPEGEYVYDIPESEGIEPELAADVELGAWKYLVYAFFLLLTLACAVLIGMYIYRLVKSRDRGGRKRKARKRRSFLAGLDDDDEVESTLDVASLFDKRREDLRSALARLRRRASFNDMPDDPARVRFAFRELKRAGGTETETPLELARGKAPAVQRLSADYSAMRYGDIAPSPESGENARLAMAEIKKIRK